MTPRLKLLIAPVLAAVVLLGAALGYKLLEDWTFGEALYEAAMIVSTVGLKEIRPMGRAGHIWTFIVIVFGVVTIMVVYGVVTSTIVSGELRRVMGRRTLRNKLRALDGHFIVCGYGRMGQSVVAQLKQHGATVVVVDNDPETTAKLEEQGILYALGDAEEEETLKEAGVMRAAGLIAALSEDSANVYVTLTARGLRDDLNIAARAEQPSAEPKLLRAGADRVICPAVIGATRVANLMVRPNVADFIEVTAKGVELELDEYVVGPDSPLRNQTLMQANLRQKTEVMVVAINRADGQTVYNPSAREEIREGDTLIVIGRTGAAARLPSGASQESGGD